MLLIRWTALKGVSQHRILSVSRWIRIVGADVPPERYRMENQELLEANGIIQQMITAINSGNPLRMNVAVEVAQEYMSRPTQRAADVAEKPGYDYAEAQKAAGHSWLVGGTRRR